MNKQSDTISTLLLERYLCNEVTLQEKERIHRALRQNDALQQRLAALRASNESIFTTYPADSMVRDIALRNHTVDVAGKFRNRQTSPHPVFSIRSIGMACLLLLSIAGVSLFISNQFTMNETTRVKGHHPYLTIYRKAAAEFEKLPADGSVAAHDQIQIGYVAAGAKYGFIFSVDGNGAVTTHFPEQTSGAAINTVLAPEGEHLLSQAFELDNAPCFERFFFVTSSDSIAMQQIIDQCSALFATPAMADAEKRLVLPKQYRQMSIILYKEAVQ